ncbi:hypothetical protein ALC152_11690 [Arcobacter sp. 15-2]|uniref:hypothetical protein n=1 Tax=Arcobacter sp. 15-2 TaxID=3374109 RepID=UPI00399C5898
MNELSELDQLIESDILEALGEKQDTSSSEDDILIEDAEDEILIEDFNESPDDKKLPEPEIEAEENTGIEKVSNQNTISEVSTHDLASLLSQLLNNKTIEITIKIKD